MAPNKIERIISSGKNVYVVGIKGGGVAGLAQILKSKGFKVSGSDTHEKFFTDAILRKNRIPFKEGFSAKNISSLIRANRRIDWVLASNAYLMEPVKNPEILEVRRRKIPILSYPEVLSHFFNQSFGVAVAGTHGKTSVSAMIAFIFQYAGLKPNAIIGGEVLDWSSNAIVGNSNVFVLEADEYKDAFLNYKPDIAVILNTDWDHPDYFKSHADYKRSFKKFAANIKPGGRIITAESISSLIHANRRIRKIDSSLIGEFNQFNLRAAYAVAHYMGIPRKKILAALKKFKGTRRRLEVVGKLGRNILIDDYAHNAQKVKAALRALKKHHKNRELIVVFQPHTFSRTEQFLEDFADALSEADKIYLLDIYASAREKIGTVTSDNLVELVNELGKIAVNLNSIPNAAKFFKEKIPKNSVIVSMGAGDVGKLAYILAGRKELI